MCGDVAQPRAHLVQRDVQVYVFAHEMRPRDAGDRLSHGARSTLGAFAQRGEEQHLAQRVRAGDQRDEAVDADAEPAGRRHAVLQRDQEILVRQLDLVVSLGGEPGLRDHALALLDGVVQLRVGVRDLVPQHEDLEALDDALLTRLALGERRYLYRVVEEERRLHELRLHEGGHEHVEHRPPRCARGDLQPAIGRELRERLDGAGYIEVNTPQMLDRTLWEASGHWEKFRDKMFTTNVEDSVLALKPMNCPGHVQIFKQGTTSYRDLPIRMAEFGVCLRKEPSGALHGLMRVRAFVQDDAHIFCTENQITSETQLFCTLLLSVYKDLGFEDVVVQFSDRPEVRAGSDETWDKAEKALRDATKATGLETELNPGDGAFYGPKLDFVLRDAIGRDWQCGTLQVDFVLPERLDANYIGEDGEKHRPVMLHRAILGSFERFLGILIEHYAGKFPLWLAPLQIVVATITNDADDYAIRVHAALIEAGLKAELDIRNEKINYKIREHSVAKVPVILVVGAKEAADGTVAMRRLGGKDQENLALEEATARLKEEAAGPLARR